MIYVTGDIHGNPVRLNTENFPEQKEMTKDDYVIICGDFGLVWNRDGESKEEKHWLDWLEDKPFTTLFVDGNHECHNRLDNYPVEEWHGGKVHKIRPSVIHLMRGQVFEIGGLKFFTFGGASSHDISDGILEYDNGNWKQKAKELERQGKYMYRIKDLSWWDRELPSQEEMDEGIRNLAKHNNQVDFIISHCAPASTVALIGHGLYEQDILTLYFEEIRATTEYKAWLFGHYHINRKINDKEICIYEQITRIH